MIEQYLIHYGVKGMRWGMRKDRNAKVDQDINLILKSLKKSDFKDFDDPKKAYYKKVQYDNNEPAGFVMATPHNERGNLVVDVSYAVSPNHRGKNLASKLLKESVKDLDKDSKVKKIYLGVEKDNAASVHVINSIGKKLGFSYQNSDGKNLIYAKEKPNRSGDRRDLTTNIRSQTKNPLVRNDL